MDVIDGDQPDIAVNAPIHVEIGGQGRNVGVKAVIYPARQFSWFSQCNIVGYVVTKCGVAANVFSDEVGVNVDLRRLVGALEIKIQPLIVKTGWQLEVATVPGRTPAVAGRFVKWVFIIPRMREGYPAPVAVAGVEI